MTIAGKHLRTRFFYLISTGLLAYLVDNWSKEYSGALIPFVRIILIILVLVATIADEIKGTLKASPIYRATFEEATSLRFVQVSIVMYLLAILVFIFIAIFTSGDTDFPVSSTWYWFLYLSPLFVISFAGKYVIEKEENDDLL